MKKIATLIIGLLLVGITMLQAQRQDYPERYIEGELFVKLKNQSHISLPEWTALTDASVLLSQGLVDLHQLVQQYEVNTLEQAFRTRGEDLDNIYYLTFAQKDKVSQLFAALEGLNYIEYVEKVPVCYPTYIPNDYDSTAMYHLRLLGAPGAWDVTKGSPEVKIAIVDNAVLITHPDLAPNVWINQGEIPNNNIDDDGNGYIDDVTGWDTADEDEDPNPPTNAPGFASFNHGTSVAGCAAAATDNNVGISGIGFNCKLIGIKIKSSFNITDNLFSGADALQGMDYAVLMDADVVNTSFVFGGVSSVFQAIVDQGTANGTVFVGGAGNSSSNTAFSPATLNNVISVAGTNQSDRKSGFSTFHSTVDISAPGSRIRTTSYSNPLTANYTITDGTSFSSPIVAGVVGLMKSANPCLSPADIEAILKSTAKNIDNLNPAYVGLLGAGRVNAAAALRATQLTAAPVAKFGVDSTDICEGIVRCFYAPTLPNCADSLAWSVNGQTSHSLAPTFQFDSAGTYMVRLFVKNSMGNNEDSVSVTVERPIIIDAGGNDNDQFFVCFGQEKQIPATSNTPGATYRWSPTFGLDNPNNLNPVLRVTSTATYTLTATDPGGCVVTKVLSVVLAVAPNVNAGQDESILYQDSVQLNPTATGNGLSYMWSPGLGLSDSTISNPFAKPAVTTQYTLTITDNNDCTDDDKLTVNVSGVGIDEEVGAGISLLPPAPNPAMDKMFLGLDLEKTAFVSLTVYDLQGKKLMKLYNEKSLPGSLRILWNKETLHAGMYLLVWQIDGHKAVQKVIWN